MHKELNSKVGLGGYQANEKECVETQLGKECELNWVCCHQVQGGRSMENGVYSPKAKVYQKTKYVLPFHLI